jgi:hypothetical protein
MSTSRWSIRTRAGSPLLLLVTMFNGFTGCEPADDASADRPASPRVLVLGDGVVHDVVPALEAVLAETDATVIAYPAFGMGLARPESSFDWRAGWSGAMHDVSPDVVVVHLGYWDVPEAGLVDGAGAEAWTTSYRAAVVEAAELLTATGARVIWIGAPWFADRSVPGVRRLNHVYREVAANLEHVQFVDVARRLSGSADEYRERDGTDVMRKPDGVHLCPDGAAIVAVAVAAKLGVPAPIGWESSGWRSDPRYFTAQGGSCPAA